MLYYGESMAEIQTQEAQQEFFEEFSETLHKPERFPFVTKTQKPIFLSTSTEQILLASILLILSFCLVFFLGVLRGRALETRLTAGAAAAGENAPLPVRPAHHDTLVAAAAPATTAAVETRPAASALLPTALNLNKPYTIQLVTYKKKALAEKDIGDLRQKGYAAMIITSGEYFQVCAGQYFNKDEARKDLKLFSVKHKDCFLRRR